MRDFVAAQLERFPRWKQARRGAARRGAARHGTARVVVNPTRGWVCL
jgi:hypothetical protein